MSTFNAAVLNILFFFSQELCKYLETRKEKILQILLFFGDFYLKQLFENKTPSQI